MKLISAIQKDIRILFRDKVGIALMFAMPILLVIIVTYIQNNTFDLLNKKNITIQIADNDTGNSSKQFIALLNQSGMFQIDQLTAKNETIFKNNLFKSNASIGIFLSNNFSKIIHSKAAIAASKAMDSFGLEGDSANPTVKANDAIIFYYNPSIDASFKASIQGAINSALQVTESKQILRNLYSSINEKPLPDSLEKEMLKNDIPISEVPLSFNNKNNLINASQHNVPSWTIFAMFFIIISLGASVVREKTSGSFIRLKTLPTNFYMALLSKQIVYMCVAFLQAIIIFSIGIFFFPLVHLPAIQLPRDVWALIIVTFFCGWCAVSYALCVGVFAHTQEQANGFGAISIVILAVIGGLMIPDFAMPQNFKPVTNISPLHWCLEAYYSLFLKGGGLSDVLINIVPIFAIIVVLQLLTLWGLHRKNLI